MIKLPPRSYHGQSASARNLDVSRRSSQGTESSEKSAASRMMARTLDIAKQKRKAFVKAMMMPIHHTTGTSSTSSSNLGRRGDPRMNRAMEARLANPHMTLLDALLVGGFEFPDLDRLGKSDRSVRDSDNVKLCQRKNQLSRRLRKEKRKQAMNSKVSSMSIGVVADTSEKHFPSAVEVDKNKNGSGAFVVTSTPLYSHHPGNSVSPSSVDGNNYPGSGNYCVPSHEAHHTRERKMSSRAQSLMHELLNHSQFSQRCMLGEEAGNCCETVPDRRNNVVIGAALSGKLNVDNASSLSVDDSKVLNRLLQSQDMNGFNEMECGKASSSPVATMVTSSMSPQEESTYYNNNSSLFEPAPLPEISSTPPLFTTGEMDLRRQEQASCDTTSSHVGICENDLTRLTSIVAGNGKYVPATSSHPGGEMGETNFSLPTTTEQQNVMGSSSETISLPNVNSNMHVTNQRVSSTFTDNEDDQFLAIEDETADLSSPHSPHIDQSSYFNALQKVLSIDPPHLYGQDEEEIMGGSDDGF